MSDAPIAPVVPPTPGDPQVGPVGSAAKPYVEFPTDLILKVAWSGAVAIVTIAGSPQVQALGLQIADPGSDGTVVRSDPGFGLDPPYTDGTLYSPSSAPGVIDSKQYLSTGIYYDTTNFVGPELLPLTVLAPAQGFWSDFNRRSGSVGDQSQADAENAAIASPVVPSRIQNPDNAGQFITAFDGQRLNSCGVPVVPHDPFFSVSQLHVPNILPAVTVGGPSPQEFFLVNFGKRPDGSQLKTVNIVQPNPWLDTRNYTQVGSVTFSCTPSGFGFVIATFPSGLPGFIQLSTTDYQYTASAPVLASHSKVTVAVYAGGTFQVNPDGSIGNTGGALVWTGSRDIPDGGTVGSALGSFNASGFLTP